MLKVLTSNSMNKVIPFYGDIDTYKRIHLDTDYSYHNNPNITSDQIIDFCNRNYNTIINTNTFNNQIPIPTKVATLRQAYNDYFYTNHNIIPNEVTSIYNATSNLPLRVRATIAYYTTLRYLNDLYPFADHLIFNKWIRVNHPTTTTPTVTDYINSCTAMFYNSYNTPITTATNLTPTSSLSPSPIIITTSSQLTLDDINTYMTTVIREDLYQASPTEYLGTAGKIERLLTFIPTIKCSTSPYYITSLAEQILRLDSPAFTSTNITTLLTDIKEYGKPFSLVHFAALASRYNDTHSPILSLDTSTSVYTPSLRFSAYNYNYNPDNTVTNPSRCTYFEDILDIAPTPTPTSSTPQDIEKIFTLSTITSTPTTIPLIKYAPSLQSLCATTTYPSTLFEQCDFIVMNINLSPNTAIHIPIKITSTDTNSLNYNSLRPALRIRSMYLSEIDNRKIDIYTGSYDNPNILTSHYCVISSFNTKMFSARDNFRIEDVHICRKCGTVYIPKAEDYSSLRNTSATAPITQKISECMCSYCAEHIADESTNLFGRAIYDTARLWIQSNIRLTKDAFYRYYDTYRAMSKYFINNPSKYNQLCSLIDKKYSNYESHTSTLFTFTSEDDFIYDNIYTVPLILDDIDKSTLERYITSRTAILTSVNKATILDEYNKIFSSLPSSVTAKSTTSVSKYIKNNILTKYGSMLNQDEIDKFIQYAEDIDKIKNPTLPTEEPIKQPTITDYITYRVPAYIPRDIILDCDIHNLFYDESNNINYGDALCEFMFRISSVIDSLYDSKELFITDSEGNYAENSVIDMNNRINSRRAFSQQPSPMLRILNYTYKPEPSFECPAERTNKLHLGVELEIEAPNDIKKDLALLRIQKFNTELGKDLIYCKHDGSLSGYGIEMVFEPQTLAFFEDNDKLKQLFDDLISLGCKSHNTRTCGLHVHLDNKFFKAKSVKYKRVAVSMFFNERYTTINEISRRKGDYYWCNFIDYAPNLADGATSLTDTEFDSYYNEIHDGCRYRAVNVCNRNTIELRYMKGTLNYTTFVNNLRFITESCVFIKKNVYKHNNLMYTLNSDIYTNKTLEFLGELPAQEGGNE